MNALKVKHGTGEGQSTCRVCAQLGRWSRTWTSFLYEVEGLEGFYCMDCLKKYVLWTGNTIELEDGRLLNES